MTKDEAVRFLQAHQPMPSDWDITEAEGELYSQVMEYFIAHPDPVCIPLFLNSLSEETSLGMYHVLDVVFRQFKPEQLTPHLMQALQSGDIGMRWYGVNYALGFPSEQMLEPLEAIFASQEDEDAHYLAIATLRKIWKETANEKALQIIRDRQQIGDRETKQFIKEILREADTQAS